MACRMLQTPGGLFSIPVGGYRVHSWDPNSMSKADLQMCYTEVLTTTAEDPTDHLELGDGFYSFECADQIGAH